MGLVNPDDRGFVAETVQKMLAEGRGFDFTKRIVRPDGEIRSVRCVGVPSTHGTSQGFVGTGIDVTEQEELTQQLRQREAYLAEAQRLSHTGSFGWNYGAAGELTWSEETYRILECDRSTKPTFELVRDRVHPDDLQMWEEAFAQASEGKQVDFEHRLLMPNGSVKHLHVVAYGIQRDGTYVELVGTAMDITERKRAEEIIRRSEAYLAEAQRLSQTGSFAWSPSTDNTYYSEECYRVLGFEPQGALPPPFETVMQRIHPDDQSRCRERVEKAIRDKVDVELDYRIIHPDNTVRDIHCVSHVVLDRSGRLVEIVGTVIDITARKRAEETIRRSEAFLAEGQRLSHTGSWGWNASTGKITWSQEHFRILGLDPQHINPSLDVFWERVHPDDRIGLQRAFESAIRDKRDFEQEFRIITPDSVVKHLHGVGHPTLNKANELVEFIGSTMDITERKRAETSLQEARSELERVNRVTTMGELAASIAHEVNQPLAGVVTSANAGLNWLAANPPNLSKTREALERILRDGTRGGDVLAKIRGFLKRTVPARALVSVNGVARDVLALVSEELRRHHIELSLELAPTLPPIHGDCIQLQQVLLNLIKNAIEAMEGTGNGKRTLRIKSGFGELDGKPAIVAEVSDTGMGFGGRDNCQLFEAFHTTKPQGMGMGLWISRSIIENHHGRLTASANPGPGATFVILLPKANQEQT